MTALSALERAVLMAIARQAPKNAEIFAGQIENARVVARENTGAGFFTTFETTSPLRFTEQKSPVGFVEASVAGLVHGMGFLLWLKDGAIYQLEGYSKGGEDTRDLDLEHVAHHSILSFP